MVRIAEHDQPDEHGDLDVDRVGGVGADERAAVLVDHVDHDGGEEPRKPAEKIIAATAPAWLIAPHVRSSSGDIVAGWGW